VGCRTLAAEAPASRRGLLDPVARISEILFGLIMALTFTSTLSAATAERDEIRTLLAGAIGCNIAWGIVDAVMFLLSTITERGRELLSESRAAGEPPPRPRFTKTDWLSALAIFLLVFLSTFPVVLPFVIFAHVPLAIRMSNLVAIVMLFFVGYVYARHGGLSPWRTGGSMVLLGLALVAITVALGG
jgi:VIT1/CCC1 family predicted Fe2+/Mn2+ transporter